MGGLLSREASLRARTKLIKAYDTGTEEYGEFPATVSN
jgi:hypothetical protein